MRIKSGRNVLLLLVVIATLVIGGLVLQKTTSLDMEKLKCYDGYCSDLERQTGSCPHDCSHTSSETVPPQSIPKDESRCGDGYCNELERLGSSCQKDCTIV